MLTYPPLPVDSVDKVDNLYKPTWTGPYQHLLDGRLSSTVVTKLQFHILYITVLTSFYFIYTNLDRFLSPKT